MLKKILYFYSKMVLKAQLPSIRNSDIHSTSKVGYRSNIVNTKMDKMSYTGSNNTIVDAEIGKYCSIASYCSIGGGNHPLNWVSTSPYFYNEKEVSNISISKEAGNFKSSETVLIGNDVWIGENTFIKSGIKIGDGAVVGAHSVITKNVPKYAIVAGNPAKIIRYRFNDQQIKKLDELKWWDFDEIVLKSNLQYMNDVDKFVEMINLYKGRQ